MSSRDHTCPRCGIAVYRGTCRDCIDADPLWVKITREHDRARAARLKGAQRDRTAA